MATSRTYDKATHLAGPVIGSERHATKKYHRFLTVPIECINDLEWNYAPIGMPGAFVASVTVPVTSGGWCMGSGSTGNVPTSSVDATGRFSMLTNALDQSETILATQAVFKPTANKPIYLYLEFQAGDFPNTHGAVGLSRITNVNVAGPLVATSGAVGTEDHIYLYWQSTNTLTLNIRDGAAAADSVALTTVGTNATNIRLSLMVTDTKVHYYVEKDGTAAESGTTTPTTTLTDLQCMSGCFAIQNDEAAGNTITVVRGFVAQEKLDTTFGV